MSEPSQNKIGVVPQPPGAPESGDGGPDLNSQPSSSLPPGDSPAFSPAKGESDRAFEAFRAYLELGPRRRYAAVGRKVGASLRTIQRWANDYDWRARIKIHSASCADQSARTESAVHCEEILDAAARAKAFRERQFALAEAILDLAERYLERVGDEDLEQMRFTDACKALDFASRIAGRAGQTDAAAPDHSLRDQLASLLNQACGETPARPGAASLPSPTTPT
jgi:hypothetical protein